MTEFVKSLLQSKSKIDKAIKTIKASKVTSWVTEMSEQFSMGQKSKLLSAGNGRVTNFLARTLKTLVWMLKVFLVDKVKLRFFVCNHKGFQCNWD